METINGTQVPISSSSATSISSSTTVLSTTTTTTTISTTSQTTTGSASTATSSSTSGDIVSTSPTTVPESASKTSTISPLVIGLISAGSVALVVAIIAIALLLRTRRRFKDDSGDFTSLRDNPSSPTDETSKSSIFKSEESQDILSRGAAVGAPFGAMAAGRSSSNTVRSAEPMIKEAPNMLAYNSTQSPPSPTASLPLVERGSPILGRTPESSEGVGSGAETTDGVGSEKSSRGTKGSALTAGDAQLIAETFRKSMRRPRWDDTDDQDEEEQDEARRAANELLKRELSEQGLDVQRGVQRRVTIQDSTHRSSAHPPLSHKTDDSRS
ncbi:hypothetical protein BGZ80_011638 [Entomortierella chlamydospora]|uniref:Uncharacterized protein n=1 Tax=Entomortierella chlamydospora TaxID=101097 RepID=A0A9P6SYV3_9FUNG|nr:hypothetical protein BGZ80_011638 [Entomortierella chlamydospora]